MRLTAPERAARLLAIVPWVAAAGGATLDEIADRFDYPRDRLESDLVDVVGLMAVYPYTPDEMIELFVDPETEWVSVSYDQFFNRPLRLSPEQALALVGAGSGLAGIVGDDATPLASGLRKLAAQLGVEPGETIAVDLGGGDPELLQLVRDSVAGHQQLEIDYYSHSRDERSTRVVDPHRVFSEDGEWYLAAWCHRATATRSFRLDRIHSASGTGQTFEPRDDIATGLFTAADRLPRATIDVDASASWVASYYPVDSVKERRNGALRVTLPVSAPTWLERLLLQLGPHASVVKVEEPLVTDVGVVAAQRVLARYGQVPPTDAA